MNEKQIARLQGRSLGHNPLVDLLFGGVSARAILTEGIAAGEVGPIPIRVYRPIGHAVEPLPLVLNFHGGGWVLGHLDQSDWLCSNVAASVGATVVSIDY